MTIEHEETIDVLNKYRPCWACDTCGDKKICSDCDNKSLWDITDFTDIIINEGQ